MRPCCDPPPSPPTRNRPPQMTEMERQRAELIARNRERLMALNLPGMAAELLPQPQRKAPAAAQHKGAREGVGGGGVWWGGGRFLLGSLHTAGSAACPCSGREGGVGLRTICASCLRGSLAQPRPAVDPLEQTPSLCSAIGGGCRPEAFRWRLPLRLMPSPVCRPQACRASG